MKELINVYLDLDLSTEIAQIKFIEITTRVERFPSCLVCSANFPKIGHLSLYFAVKHLRANVFSFENGESQASVEKCGLALAYFPPVSFASWTEHRSHWFVYKTSNDRLRTWFTRKSSVNELQSALWFCVVQPDRAKAEKSMKSSLSRSRSQWKWSCVACWVKTTLALWAQWFLPLRVYKCEVKSFADKGEFLNFGGIKIRENHENIFSSFRTVVLSSR